MPAAIGRLFRESETYFRRVLPSNCGRARRLDADALARRSCELSPNFDADSVAKSRAVLFAIYCSLISTSTPAGRSSFISCVDRLVGRVDDVHQPQVRADLELVARRLVDVRRAQDVEALDRASAAAPGP